MKISNIKAFEILDSRGNPTIMTKVYLDDGSVGQAMVPSGASTGVYEAVELRDSDPKRYLGKGVLKAVSNVNDTIKKALLGKDPCDQEKIDKIMIDLDGTENKGVLGANAILSVSMAVVRAVANSKKMPLYRYIAELFGNNTDEFFLPTPMLNVLNGGKHATNSADMQEYMIVPIGASSIREAVRWSSEVFHILGKILKSKGMPTTVGDEGGYAPTLSSNEEPLDLILEALEKAGYKPYEDFGIALDPAASEFYKNGKYILKIENKELSTDELIDKYDKWVSSYPIVSIEDGLAEDDWDGFVKMTEKMGDKIQIVGDDLLVTNTKRLKKAIELKAVNSILIKLNQIGTVTETIEAIKMAKQANMTAVVSHRSGETEDTFIADFVVGAGTGQIKTGSMSRSERIAKYNRLMLIEQELEEKAKFVKFPYKPVK